LLGVFVPEQSLSHFASDTFFFSHSSEQGNRFGMIVQLENPQEASQAFNQWESQMEQDLRPLMLFWGQKGSGYAATFRSTTYQGVEVRFQTFSTQDYGIVYAIVDNYLILASSFDATKATIEALQALTSFSQPRVSEGLRAPEGFKPPPSLSFQEAVGQVLMIGFNDSELTPELKDIMRRLQPGGVLLLSRNIKSVEQLQRLTGDLQKVSLEYSQLPLLIAVDQEGGDISRIEFGKEKTAQSDIESVDHAYVVGEERAEELKFLGVNLNLSPVLDATSPEDFLFSRTFQTERFEAGRFAKALLAGQHQAGILSTVKHFPGYGSIPFNPEKKLATVQEFPDISPFVFTFPGNPEFVLLSNVVYENFDAGNPFTFSRKGMKVLRDELGFEGLIISDDLVQPSLLDNYSFDEIAALPLEAGVNMVMFSEQAYATDAHDTLLKIATENSILKRNIENSAARILEMKKQFFFDSNQPLPLDHLSQSK
jgi:beta-N-acetylhexosaminidase